MSDSQTRIIGISLGLGIPYTICMIYLIRKFACPDCCKRKRNNNEIQQTPNPIKTKRNYKLKVKEGLSSEAYIDFLQGKISIHLRNELINLKHKKSGELTEFIEFAKEIDKPHLVNLIKDPIGYPIICV